MSRMYKPLSKKKAKAMGLSSKGVTKKTVDKRSGKERVNEPQGLFAVPCHKNPSSPSLIRSGGPRLRQTQTYPPEFGRVIARHHLVMMKASLLH